MKTARYRGAWINGALAFALIFLFLPQAKAQTVTLPGLDQPVQVAFDAEGVWHITAQSDLDAAFAQGYLHARDRFFQMDLSRRILSGTLGELFGMTVLSQDIELRTIGLRRAALRSWRNYDAQTRAVLQAYAGGVNAWLASNPLPPEYGALELSRAEPWRPVDSILVAKGLAFQLSFDLDIDRTIRLMAYQQAGQIGGFNGAAFFFEDTHRTQPFDDRVSIPGFFEDTGIIGKSADEGTAKGPVSYQLDYLTAETLAAAKDYKSRIQDIPLLAKTMQPRENRGASNWWIVSGDHTESGHPILANDPHLSLNLPPVFAEGHIVVEGSNPMNVTGTLVPGAPGVILGCTTRVCWGATTNPMDVTDTFSDPIIKNSLGFPTHTVFGGQREPIIWVFQSYFVNNPGDGAMDNLTRAPVGLDSGGITFVVPRRDFGPILSIQGDTALTVQYTGFGPTQELRTFQIWNRARNLSDFREGLKWFDFGSQNWAYADVDGNIAYFTSGELPLRRDLQRDNAPDGGVPPFVIRDGANPRHQWLPQDQRPAHQSTTSRILPMDEMPHVINPDSGYIANANNDPVGTTLDNNSLNQVRPGGGLYYLNPGYASLRMGRIDRVLQALLDGSEPVTVADMEVLQSNHQLLDAELIAPFVLQAFQNASASGAPPILAQFAQEPAIAGAVQLLGQWDFSTPTGLTEGYGPTRLPGTPPGAQEIAHSAAATIFSTWRGQFLANTIDGVFNAIGLGDFRPGSREAYNAMAFQLMNFGQTNGVGASGIPFFNVPDVGDPAVARDVILLKSLADALELLGSDEFADAFGDAQTLTDFRWGKLHRIVFDHPLGPPFNAPPAGGFADVGPGLPGVARTGGYQAVDASSHSARADGLNDFMFGSGPARRFVGQMDPDGIEAQQIIPGGQSGVFVSPFYINQLERWLTNQYKPLVLDPNAVSAQQTLTLQPAG